MMCAAAWRGDVTAALILALGLALGPGAAMAQIGSDMADRPAPAEAPADAPAEAAAKEPPVAGPATPPPPVAGGDGHGAEGVEVEVPRAQYPPPSRPPSVSLRPRSRPVTPPGDGAATPALLEFTTGQQVFAAIAIECADQADFLRGYWSIVETLPTPAADTPLLIVRPREHIVMLANHNLPETDETGADNVTYGDYWCIPKRAFCYETAAETAFDSKHPLGAQLGVDPAMTVTVQNGIVRAAKDLLTRHCNRTWEADR